MPISPIHATIIATVCSIGATGPLAPQGTDTKRPVGGAKVGDLAWLAGRWSGGDAGELSEEVWTAPAGDSMMGMWRHVAGGRARVFELLTITEEAGSPVLRIRHFSPELVAWEEKESPVSLPLVASRAREATFEGSDALRGGTVRISYRRTSEEELTAVLETASGRQEFTFRRKGP